jgi:hypothetical protein
MESTIYCRVTQQTCDSMLNQCQNLSYKLQQSWKQHNDWMLNVHLSFLCLLALI